MDICKNSSTLSWNQLEWFSDGDCRHLLYQNNNVVSKMQQMHSNFVTVSYHTLNFIIMVRLNAIWLDRKMHMPMRWGKISLPPSQARYFKCLFKFRPLSLKPLLLILPSPVAPCNTVVLIHVAQCRRRINYWLNCSVSILYSNHPLELYSYDGVNSNNDVAQIQFFHECYGASISTDFSVSDS